MVVRWFVYGKRKPHLKGEFDALPSITVQIPLYNERFVAKRIIEACGRLRYPRHQLHVQIVDDSTDDTKYIVAEEVAKQKALGLNIEHIHRTNRQGFKAGALKEAMEHSSGEFIAIFDADFIPPENVLIDNIGYFTQPKLAMLQFRWEHLNRYSSKMTQSQAMMLDAHFGLEQQIRWSSNKLFNFNGTAGVWRKTAIYDAGNWSADTLTEDLDLSYRAQMRGWEMLYLNDVVCPGELPANLNAFKSQQHRWAKGGLQVMRKLFKPIWRHSAPFTLKLEASFHLANNLAYFLMLIDTLFFLLPSLFIRDYFQLGPLLWLDIILMFFSTFGHLIYLFFGQVALGHSKRTALVFIPRLMLLGIQLAFNNARAGFEALIDHQSEFVRTPKSGEQNAEKNAEKSVRQTISVTSSSSGYRAIVPNSSVIELFVAITYSIVFIWAMANEVWVMMPFLLVLIVGFFTTAVDSIKHKLKPD
jgi:cellulose synthase/poly-beta-1,6-N-acetylglucosamine synthase-like glycosyltransferase